MRYCSSKRKGKKGKSIYLDPEMEAINDAISEETYNMALTVPDKVKDRTKSYNYHGAGSTVSTYKSCVHTGDKVIFEHAGKKLYAANGSGLNEYSGKWDLIIDLASQVRHPIVTNFIKSDSAKRFDVLKQFLVNNSPTIKSEVLSLGWPDMGIAPASLDFWENLWNMLPEKTVACCFGGHGRTGTCLAALQIATGVDYYTAIDNVRNEHCKSAIESLVQEQYLHSLWVTKLKRMVKDDPDLQHDLDHALKHVPTAHSSYGTEEYTERKDNKGHGNFTRAGSTTPTNSVNGDPVGTKYEMLEDVYYKVLPNGDIFIQECIDRKCLTINCIVGAHQGWIPFEFETMGYKV